MKKIYVENNGRYYPESYIDIPRDSIEVEVESYPDFDLYLYLNGEFVLRANYEAIQAEKNNIALQYNIEKNVERRQEAYRSESDPLYMEWQYDQTPEKEQAWRDKVAEIKARYPLPSES
ncbi:TPA: hypothetical protein ACF37B_004442 [Vibrio parahaemolyticus]